MACAPSIVLSRCFNPGNQDGPRSPHTRTIAQYFISRLRRLYWGPSGFYVNPRGEGVGFGRRPFTICSALPTIREARCRRPGPKSRPTGA